MKRLPLIVAAALAALAFCVLFGAVVVPIAVPAAVFWVIAVGATAVAGNELLGRPVPFLRWSFLRMMLGMGKLLTEWQVGDGREEKVADFVLTHAKKGDVDDVIARIDEFAYEHSFLINVGDEKGAILDEALERAQPKRVLELGAYVGYSALRIARQLPADAHVYSVEFNAANADIARRIVEHAGMSDRITFVVGYLGDENKTLARLEEEHGFTEESVDFVFLDHDKDVYLSDLQLLLDKKWLRAGSSVVADNVGFPGAPEYRAYMKEHEGTLWKTREHASVVEYQSIVKDLVLESILLA